MCNNHFSIRIFLSLYRVGCEGSASVVSSMLGQPCRPVLCHASFTPALTRAVLALPAVAVARDVDSQHRDPEPSYCPDIGRKIRIRRQPHRSAGRPRPSARSARKLHTRRLTFRIEPSSNSGSHPGPPLPTPFTLSVGTSGLALCFPAAHHVEATLPFADGDHQASDQAGPWSPGRKMGAALPLWTGEHWMECQVVDILAHLADITRHGRR